MEHANDELPGWDFPYLLLPSRRRRTLSCVQVIKMFGYNDNVEFKQLPQSEDCESLSHEPEKSSSFKSYSQNIIPRLLTALLLVTTLIVGAVLGAWLGSNHFIKANEFCIHEVSQDCTPSQSHIRSQKLTPAAPLLDEIEINFSTIRFNGSLLKENIFRRPASPEVDAAWSSLGVDCLFISLPHLPH